MPKRKTRSRWKAAKNWTWVLGLTGGVGSGKSTVLAIFKKKKIFSLDADHLVHWLLDKDKTVLRILKKTFGSSVFQKNNQLNKPALARMVFSNPKKRKRLERILHPRVRQAMAKALQKKKGRIAICDVPLLFESGWHRKFDKVIVVKATNKTRIKRLKKRGHPLSDIRARMKAQWPLSRKVKKADFVIDNNGTRKQTQRQVNHVYHQILNIN